MKKSLGVTLLEILLVLAIGASLILMGLQVYQSFNRDKEYFILKSNVDLLFETMKEYYQSECNLYFSSNGSVRARGALTFNPNHISPAPALAPVPFDIGTTSDYLASTWPLRTTIVAPGNMRAVYFAQFNPSDQDHFSVQACNYSGEGSPQCTPPREITQSQVILWQSQVIVKMKDPQRSTYYLGLVGADCAIDEIPENGVVNCATGVALGGRATYLVWQRMPSWNPKAVSSIHWMSNPRVKQFKLQYTHDPMYEMVNPSAAPSEVYKYYLCGG